jgi:hypothetical protein
MSHRIAVKRDTTTRPRIAAALGVLTAAAVVAAVATVAWPQHRTEPTATAAPAAVLGRPEPGGSLRLLVFLATQPDTAAGPSRSQAVEVGSLMNQYGGRGLTAEIVDESGAAKNALINTYYDWQLRDIRLTADPGRALAARYGVGSAPVTLLLDRNGAVVARWDSYALPAQAAHAISSKLT